VWVPETRRTSCDLLILVKQSAESIAPFDLLILVDQSVEPVQSWMRSVACSVQRGLFSQFHVVSARGRGRRGPQDH